MKVSDIKNFLDEMKIEYQIFGSLAVKVDYYRPLNSIQENKITWVKNWDDETEEKLNRLQNLIIVCKETVQKRNKENCYIVCSDPKMCFFEILEKFYLGKETVKGISQYTVIKTNKIGKDVSIGEFSYIGEDVKIGENVTIGTRVTITGKVEIGDNVVIADGCVLGKSGYGYYTAMDGHRKKVPHLGGIVIGNHVEIGANTCIDCGTMGDTIVGDNTKIDNLCHIGHNSQIGKDAMIVAGSILCGSCVVKDGAYIAPGAVIKNQITVGKDAFVGLQTAATKDVQEGTSIFGVPGQEFKRKYKI